MSEKKKGVDVVELSKPVRPEMTEEDARDLVLRLYGLESNTVAELPSYDDRNYYVSVNNNNTEDVDNPRGTEAGRAKDEFVLKVMNAEESQKQHVGMKKSA